MKAEEMKPGWYRDEGGQLVGVLEKRAGYKAQGMYWYGPMWVARGWETDDLTPYTGPQPGDPTEIPERLRDALGLPGEGHWRDKWGPKNRGGDEIEWVGKRLDGQYAVTLRDGVGYKVLSRGKYFGHTRNDDDRDLIPLQPPPPPFDPKPTEPGAWWFTTVEPTKAEGFDWEITTVAQAKGAQLQVVRFSDGWQISTPLADHPEGYWRRAIPPGAGQ